MKWGLVCLLVLTAPGLWARAQQPSQVPGPASRIGADAGSAQRLAEQSPPVAGAGPQTHGPNPARSDAGAAASTQRTTVIVVVGAPGEEEFESVFSGEANQWEKAGAQAGAKFVAIGRTPEGAAAAAPSDHDLLKKELDDEPKDGDGKVWLVLIGHGTFDGKEAKFNLRGPDVTASELAIWLKPFHRPLAVIDTSSSSAPFLNKLSGPNRVIVTATRSGSEQNYAHFGIYFAEAIGDPKSDLDKDGEVSLLEAFLSASARLAEFYKTAGRLATEHPLIDDNGDGLGTPPDWFEGTHAVKKAGKGAAADGALAQQFVLIPSAEERVLPAAVRARRDKLELAVAQLRETKATLPEDEYYRQLEGLLLQLANLYSGKDSVSSDPPR